ncbi:MAG TPA: sensor histidine kinase, partial [Terriglobales bacterium]
PILRLIPSIVHALGIDVSQVTDPFGLMWFRIAVKTACLLGLMVLLTRFHRFLLDTLKQRIAAQDKMQDEMNERHRLIREIAKVSDSERQRLGQELHDGVCQQVTAALLRCQALERRLERGGDLSGADFGPLSSLLSETIDDAHNVASGLCPLEPHPEALAPALRMLTVRMQEIAGVRCEFKAIGDVRVFDPEAAQHLYRIAQEALSNAVRHANPRRIAVELRGSDGALVLQIEDDGTGMPTPRPVNGMGLHTMSYRAQIMSGELTVAPAPGSGTRVSCRVPIAHQAHALAAGQCA